VQKRPQPKAAAAKQKADAEPAKSKPAASRSRSAVLLRTVQTQQAAHELLDQLGTAGKLQQLRNDFDSAAVQRTKNLTKLLDALRTEPQRNNKLQQLLSQQQYDRYIEMLDQPLSSTELLMQDGMPSELIKYQGLIAAADKINALADGAATRAKRSGNTAAARKHRNNAAKIYEQACEYLDEQIKTVDTPTAISIQAWLDREFDYSTDGKISIDCVGVARVRGSQSRHCLIDSKFRRVERTTVQHELQMDAVIAELQELLYEKQTAVTGAATSSNAKLKSLLHLHDQNEY